MTLLSLPYMPTVCVIAGIVWAAIILLCMRFVKHSKDI